MFEHTAQLDPSRTSIPRRSDHAESLAAVTALRRSADTQDKASRCPRSFLQLECEGGNVEGRKEEIRLPFYKPSAATLRPTHCYRKMHHATQYTHACVHTTETCVYGKGGWSFLKAVLIRYTWSE